MTEESKRPGILRELQLEGWKSIKKIDPPLEFGAINVLIGANGAGKSNLVSFFRMLNQMVALKLEEYVGIAGGAEALLHFGAKVTPKIEATLKFGTKDDGTNYSMRLAQTALDGLIFSQEKIGLPSGEEFFWGSGRPETLLKASTPGNEDNRAGKLAAMTHELLSSFRVFHFHDTSQTARIRLSCYKNDNLQLHENGSNLPAMLFLYQQTVPVAYERIVATIRQIVPDFYEFVLVPERLNTNNIRLNWRQRGQGYVLGPHQFSDGSVRAIALISLLLQPEKDLPNAIVLDEPELGLHPFALELVADLIRAASLKTQIIVATQSAAFLDQFEPAEIIVTESMKGDTRFRRLTAKELDNWLQDYTIGQLWQRNVLGGGPLP